MHIRKKSTSILRFCVFAQIIQSWKTLFSKSPLGISAHVHKNCHVSFKIWRICQRTKSNNNGAQNTYTYLKGNIQIVINLEVSVHVRKKTSLSLSSLRICTNNPALEDFVIQNHY